jgi:hypothetical protein
MEQSVLVLLPREIESLSVSRLNFHSSESSLTLTSTSSIADNHTAVLHESESQLPAAMIRSRPTIGGGALEELRGHEIMQERHIIARSHLGARYYGGDSCDPPDGPGWRTLVHVLLSSIRAAGLYLLGRPYMRDTPPWAEELVDKVGAQEQLPRMARLRT